MLNKDRLSLISLYIANNEFESAAVLLDPEDLQQAQKGIDEEIIKLHGEQALAWAVKEKRTRLCLFLLLNNVTPTPESISFLKIELGQLLHLAIKNKCIDLVKFLAENENVNVNEADNQGHTPLYNAAIEVSNTFNLAIKELLLEKKFDEKQISQIKKPIAIKNTGYEIIDLLLKQGKAYCYPSLGEQHPYIPPPEVMRQKAVKNATISLIPMAGAAYGIYALIDFIKNDPAAKTYIIDNIRALSIGGINLLCFINSTHYIGLLF